MIETVLCVDIGTTSLKAGLISADGEVLSFSTRRFSDYEDRFIANRWIFSLKAAIKDFPLEGIKAISISGNGPTVVSQSGMTIRWNEAIDYEKLGITKEQTGVSLFMPRLLAFKTLFPKDFSQSEYIFSGPEYLIYKLTGKAITILPEQRFVPAYWDKESLEKCGIKPEKMPEYVGVGHVCGQLSADSAGFLKLPEGLPVVSGGPDFVVALIGTNTLKTGRICDRCGSSEGFNYCVPEFIKEEGVRSLPSVIPGLWNVSVLIDNSSQLSEEQRFVFAEKAVATLRGIAEKYKINFPESLTVTGGQANNHRMMKKKAVALGIKLVSCQCAHAELLGDACAGWKGLGRYSTLSDAAGKIVKEDRIYENL